MGSPITLNLKCPGSMIPAWTGPTGIWYTPSPSTCLKVIRFLRVFDSLDFSIFKRFQERVKVFRVCLMQKEPSLVKGIRKLYPKPVPDFSFIPAGRRKNRSNRCRFRHDMPHKRKYVGKTAQSENIKEGKIRISLKTLDAEQAYQDKALLGKNRHGFQKLLFSEGNVKFIIIYPY